MNESAVDQRRRSTWYFPLLVLVNAMWAFQYSGARFATRKLGAITVTLLPLAMATVLLGLVLFSQRRGKSAGAQSERGSFGRQLLNFLILGLVGCFLAQFCLVFGVKLSLASNASVITLVIPVLTALLATVLVGERMTRLLWISFTLAILGVLLVSDIDWHSVAIFRGKYLAGNVMILVACFGSAFYNAFSKRMLRKFTPLEVLVYSYIVATAALGTAMLVVEPLSWQQLASLGFKVWLSLAMIAFLCLTSAMLLFFWVIKRIDLTQAALSFYLLPVFGVLISTVTLNEKVRWQLMAGGILVFIGSFLATRYGQSQNSSSGGSQ
jgi:drug/metabolite transporter (DMT)-like permease